MPHDDTVVFEDVASGAALLVTFEPVEVDDAGNVLDLARVLARRVREDGPVRVEQGPDAEAGRARLDLVVGDRRDAIRLLTAPGGRLVVSGHEPAATSWLAPLIASIELPQATGATPAGSGSPK